MKAGVVVFPGTNCDRDTFEACVDFGWDTEYIWHNDTKLNNFDIIFLPGGFSYGDYLRSGALAKFSPVMLALKEFIDKKRGLVVGICNGFQILCEAGILPGALTYNDNLKFICEIEKLNFLGKKNIFLPIAHGEGRFFADESTISELKENNMIFLTYNDNPNGSVENIAGLYNREKRVIGMMPHPERAFFRKLGSEDGRIVFEFFEQEAKQLNIGNFV